MTVFALRHARRLQTVIATLVSHGYGPLLERLPLPFRLSFRKAKKMDDSRADLAVQTRQALEQLGPTFVKIGQILSTRVDLLPTEFITELEKLRERAGWVAYEEVAQVVEEELGAAPEEIFEDFSREPLASGSVAQVHSATYGGDPVAVKIQRPHIARVIRQDIEIVGFLSRLIHGHIPESRPYRLPDLARNFGRTLQKELDFSREADSIRLFARGFAGQDYVLIPRVYSEVSTRRVLTMSRIEGRRLDELDHLSGETRRRLASRALDMSMHQVMDMGIFHADPHTGNVLVVDEEYLALFDFGNIGVVDDESREDLTDLLAGVITRDYSFVAEVLADIGQPREDLDVREFRRDVMELFEYNYDKELDQLSLGHLLLQTMAVLRRHGIGMPSGYMALLRAVAVAESSARKIYPEMQLLAEIRPRIQSVMGRRRRADFDQFWITGVRRWNRRLGHWGQKIASLVDRAEGGDLSMRFRHVGLSSFLAGLDRIAQKIIIGLLIAALIIGGSLIIQIDRAPYLFGYPALGAITFLVAGVLGMVLLIGWRR